MNKDFKAPTPITQWQTSDGKIHSTEEIARRHEVFLQIVTEFPHLLEHDNGYKVVTRLAAKYDFVRRV